MNYFGVIMAGGGGTRFWPLSREKRPKQLLNLSGKDLMINETVERMKTVIEKENIFIVTSENQVLSMLAATKGKVFTDNILVEPTARDTTACIGYAAIEIIKRCGDGIMVVMPADHYIEDVLALTDILRLAFKVAEDEDKLLTIGLKPTFPATGFGYIKYNAATDGMVKPVIEFREKPNEKMAKDYVTSGKYLWNSGIFIWKASLILQKLQELTPDIYKCLMKISATINKTEGQEVLYKIYPKIRKVPIDYAVMEPCAARGDILVIPGNCGWNDIGSWDRMNVFHKPDEAGNIFLGDVVGIDMKNCVVYSSGRTVAAVDIENLVIVETPDVVMVCPKNKAQDVKKIVNALNVAGRTELL